MIKAFTHDYKDDEDDHPNALPAPPEPDDLVKKKSSKKKKKRRSKGNHCIHILVYFYRQNYKVCTLFNSLT